MSNVVANEDIITSKGFKVASKGDRGMAVKGARPHEGSNFGKVLVYFNGRTHGYWVDASILKFNRGVDSASFIASRPEFKDPYAGEPELPKASPASYHFGNNLKLIRRSRRLSQIQLSELIGVRQSAISYRERQAYSPCGEFVTAAATALAVPEFVFFLPMDNCAMFSGMRQFICRLSSTLCEA